MKLYVVGLGPGGPDELTPRARAAIEACSVVAGYSVYIGQIEPLLEGKKVISTGMRGETERCRAAVESALAGEVTAVVSGGDAGVYGMAGLVCQLAEEHPELDIEVVPGITAACSAAALLGAPLTHDFATVSLSDLLTEWSVIEKRLRLAAEADFTLCIYNPASRSRREHLAKACAIVAEHRAPETPCGIARNVGRDGESIRLLTLAELEHTEVDMFSTVIVGSSRTKIINGRLVTPRGYEL